MFARRLTFITLFFAVVCYNRVSGQTVTDSLLVIGRIALVGNEKTKDHIIMRELAFKEGDALSRKQLFIYRAMAVRQIYNLSLFTSVDMEIQQPDSAGYTNINIYLKERWFLFVFPIMEIADRNFNTWWIIEPHKRLSRLNYGVRTTVFNIRGRNETMRVSMQGGFTRKASVDYSIPYLNKALTIGSLLNFTYSDNREVWPLTENNELVRLQAERVLYSRIKGSIGFTYRRRIYSTHYAEAEYNSLHIDDSVATLNPDYFLNGRTRQRSIYLNYHYTYDIRDFRAYPLNGYHIVAEIGNYFFIEPQAPVFNLYLNASYNKKLTLKNYITFNIGAKYSSPNRQPYNLYKAFGYGYFLRGFDYYVVDGQHFLLGKMDYIINLLPQRNFYFNSSRLDKFRTVPIAIYVKLFYDAGYVHSRFNSETNTFVNSYLSGFGAGADLVTYYDRVVRVEYAFTNKGEKGVFLRFNKTF
ncbi:MAG TPA: POTRA domain-containing protein [Bacteroidia bacterium]|nr:POTRA domain-containing protein [Bacteroidia bacterium]